MISKFVVVVLGSFRVGKLWYCGWVYDLGLENFSKFVLVGGFAIGGNSEMAKRVIL